MTRAEHDRRKRQMNRRIREVLTVRRMLAAMGPLVEPPRSDQRTTAEVGYAAVVSQRRTTSAPSMILSISTCSSCLCARFGSPGP